MASKMTGPPSLNNLLNDSQTKVRFVEDDEVSIDSSSETSHMEYDNLTRVSKARSVFQDSDSEDDSREANPSAVGKHKNAIGLMYEAADSFTTFESLMRIDKISSGSFIRLPFDIPGGKINFFPIPWPVLMQKAKNLFSKSKNIYYKLDGMFFMWTPLLTHEKTSVTIAITDRRGSNGKPTVVNSAKFESHNVTMSGMSIGNCVHMKDLKKVELSVALAKSISSKGVKYASLEVCFYISVANRPSLETHSVISPLIVPPEVKNLLKDYKRTAEFLRGSNAKIIKKKKREEEDNDLEAELNGSIRFDAPSVAQEKVKALSKTMSAKPSTQFGLSEISFRDAEK